MWSFWSLVPESSQEQLERLIFRAGAANARRAAAFGGVEAGRRVRDAYEPGSQEHINIMILIWYIMYVYIYITEYVVYGYIQYSYSIHGMWDIVHPC